MSEHRPLKKYCLVSPLRMAAGFTAAALVIGSGIFLGCGGGGGGGFDGEARVTGQAFRPVSTVVDPAPVPLGRALVTVIQFSDDSPDPATSRISITDVGMTDDNGRFDVTIPAQPIAAILVNGSVDGVSYRSAGLIPVRTRAIQKDFNAVTDIACESLTTALMQGRVDPNNVSQETINILENAATREVPNTDFTNPDSVTAAATRVAQATNDGTTPIPSDTGTGLNCTSGETACADGTPICAEQFCNRTQDCADGSDENPSTCGVAENCCTATLGCPAETATSCTSSCCCCRLNEICDPSNAANGCVAAASRSAGDSDSPLSKLIEQGVYY